MADFNALLSSKVEDAEKPKPLPTGSYLFTVKTHRFDESKQKQTPYVEFTVQPIQPVDDVDADALALVPNWNQKQMRLTFYITEEAKYRLSDFLEHCGVSIAGRTFAECIPDTTNTQFVGNVEHSPNPRDPELPFANIGMTAAA